MKAQEELREQEVIAHRAVSFANGQKSGKLVQIRSEVHRQYPCVITKFVWQSVLINYKMFYVTADGKLECK